MSCGCGGGGRGPAYHPSDSYHFQGGGGIGSPPALAPGDGLPIVAGSADGPDTNAQPDRAPAAPGAAGDDSIIAIVIVGLAAWAVLKAVT